MVVLPLVADADEVDADVDAVDAVVAVDVDVVDVVWIGAGVEGAAVAAVEDEVVVEVEAEFWIGVTGVVATRIPPLPAAEVVVVSDVVGRLPTMVCVVAGAAAAAVPLVCEAAAVPAVAVALASAGAEVLAAGAGLAEDCEPLSLQAASVRLKSSPRPGIRIRSRNTGLTL